MIIKWLIFGSIFSGVYTLLLLLGFIVEEKVYAYTLLLGVALGILNIVFGVQLLNIKNDLFGQKKPIAYLHIITGIFTASLFLMPLAIILTIVLDVVTAILFSKASREIK